MPSSSGVWSSFAAVGGTAGCGSGKQTDQHQRGAIKHRQQHFKKGARRVLAAAYGWRQYTTAKGARGAPRAGISACRAALCPAASAGRRWRGRRNPPRSRRGEVRRRSAVDKARQLALQIGVVFSQPGAAAMYITLLSNSPLCSFSTAWITSQCQKTVSPGSRSGIGKSHLIKGMPLFRDRQRAARRRITQIVVGDVVLQRAQQHIGHGVGDRHQIQRAGVGALRRQRRPARKVRNIEQTAGEAISRTSVRPSAAKGSYCCQSPEKTWRYT